MIHVLNICFSLSNEEVDEYVNKACVQGCICTFNRMSCNITVPLFIPIQITEVSIYGVDYSIYAENPPFNQSPWMNVTHLEILPDITIDGIPSGSNKNLMVYPNTFSFMKRLIQLRFSSRELRYMLRGAFCGLENLEILDLGDNIELNLSELTKGLSTCEFTNLHTLSLRGLSRTTSVAPSFDSEFFNIFKHTSLRYLDISNINSGFMDFQKFATTFVDLKYLNLENSPSLSSLFFIMFYLCMRSNHANSAFQSLEELNLNHVRFVKPEEIKDNSDIPLNLRFNQLPRDLKKLHLSGSISQGSDLNVYATEEDNYLIVSFVFRPSKLVMNVSLSFQSNYTNLEYVDLSDNNIGILSMNLSRQSNLKLINISHNNLYKTDPAVLERSVSFPNLEELYASHNSIETVAFDIFSGAPKLRHIDVSYNYLNDFRVNISHLHNLLFLNLSHNKIRYLSSSSMTMLTDFAQQRHLQKNSSVSDLSSNQSFKIDFEGNPFECSCASTEFLKWLLLNFTTSFTDSASLCDNDRSVITIDSINALAESCKVKVGMIVGLTIGGIILLILLILLLVAMKYLKRFKRTFEMKRRIQRYKYQHTKKPQVFLSYSSKNEDFVQRYIYSELNTRLQRTLNISENCVSIGDNSFSPGKPLIEELIRCIEESTIVLFCVSKEFCESKWCRDEVFVAHYEKKPIVLMFLENVQPQTMPKVLQKVYLSHTRSKWTRNESGEYELKPSWDDFCTSLSELVVNETAC